MLYELFAVGSFWFWAFIAVVFFIEIAIVATENYGASLVGLGLFLGALQAGTSLNPLSVVKNNPGWVIVGVLSYLLTGFLWMLFRWRRYVLNKVRRANDTDSTLYKYEIDVARNKENLLGWWFMWPFSLIIFFFADFVADLAEFLYNQVKDKLQTIANNLVQKYMKNLSKLS